MNFYKNQKVFPTEVHRNIHRTWLLRTPIKTSLSDTKGIDEELLKSCKSYYNFTNDMLSDMYENVAEYGLNIGGVTSYFHFLYRLAKSGVSYDDKMIISLSDYNNILGNFDSTLKKSKTTDNRIPYSTRLSAFERIRFKIDVNNEEVIITSGNHPNMFLAMCALGKSSNDVKYFGEDGFFNCEFRQIFSKYTPRYEDIVQPLDIEKRKVMDELRAFAKNNKFKEICRTRWKVVYTHKGKGVFLIETNGDFVDVRIYTGIDERCLDNIAALEDKLKSESPEFQKYALNRLKYCTDCSTCNGNYVNMLGERIFLCRVIAFSIINPVENEIDFIKKFIEYGIDGVSSDF